MERDSENPSHDNFEPKHLLEPSLQNNRTRRDALAIGGGVLGTVFSGAGIVGFQTYEQWHQAKSQRIRQAWLKALSLDTSTTMFAGDDFSLYPRSNKWANNGFRNDPRAVDLLRDIGSFIVLNGSAPRPNLQLFNPLQHSTLKSIVLAGGAINNRAARSMLGSPRRDRYLSRFVSLDKRWEADLNIGQFTPQHADIISGYDPRIGSWDFWDHSFVVGSDQLRSDFSSKDRHPSSQETCYFQITKLVSPIAKNPQSVLFVTSLHGVGSAALQMLFKDDLAQPATSLVAELVSKIGIYASWQAAVKVSEITSEGNELKIGALKLMHFEPVETRIHRV